MNQKINETEKKIIPESIQLKRSIKIQYTNWRGETTMRTIVPIELYWGKTKWHNEARDIDRNDYREYAFKDIKKFF
ncbi:WYL domain-containing protein [Candidatus Dependentiae bacterium]|nr:WYL domain-containing protein [Candidatus Dependentiae bacterium]